MSGVLKLLSENGLDQVGSALEILLNVAMRLERDKRLNAAPFERSERRRDHAYGFEAKQLLTRNGRLALSIPQTCGLEPGSDPLCPKALERGVRADRALKVAIAEMYVQAGPDAQGRGSHGRVEWLRGQLGPGVSRREERGCRAGVLA